MRKPNSGGTGGVGGSFNGVGNGESCKVGGEPDLAASFVAKVVLVGLAATSGDTYTL